MAAKRHIGLGKSAALKKRKPSDTMNSQGISGTEGNQLTVELGEEVTPNDAMAQLRALWRDYIKTQDRNEFKLNGIIHECDRILEKCHVRDVQKETKTNEGDREEVKGMKGENGQPHDNPNTDKLGDDERIELTEDFYGIFGLALSSLAFFYTEEPSKVETIFTEAKDRISVGKQKFPDSVSLLFAEARVLINEIPLTSINPLTVDSEVSIVHRDVASLLDECLAVWRKAEILSEKKKEYKYYNLENFGFLQAFDDLLDIIDNFGREPAEGKDSDVENDYIDELFLSPRHPLYAICETDKYNLWWREHTQRFLNNLDQKIQLEKIPEENNDDVNSVLRRELNKRLGQSFMQEAEEPSKVFAALTYYHECESTMNGLTKDEAQAIGQDLFSRALEFLKVAQDEEEPDSWAAVAEAMISLGNMYELDSIEQKRLYKEAEEILVRANNATNGRYAKIIENLTEV